MVELYSGKWHLNGRLLSDDTEERDLVTFVVSQDMELFKSEELCSGSGLEMLGYLVLTLGRETADTWFISQLCNESLCVKSSANLA